MSVQVLNDTWQFFYAPRGRNSKVGLRNSTEYEHQLQTLGTFYTIQGFFEHYCFLRRPSDIPVDHKLMMFRESKKPLWEKYQHGGTWIISFKRKEEEDLNKKWELLLLGAIGEQFDTTDVIGVVLSKRHKRNLLEIWIEHGANEKIKMKIGDRLQKLLNMESNSLTFYFKKHDSSLKVLHLSQDLSMFKGIEKYTFKTTPLETPNATPQMGPIEKTPKSGPLETVVELKSLKL